MENKAHALAAGLFVLLAASLLVALAMWLTRDTGVRRVFEISSPEAVNGLQPQAAVRYRGVAVGKVVSIGFDPKVVGNILVRISVDELAPITRSTFASLGFQGVTGLAFVQLDDGGESKVALTDTDGEPGRIPMRASLLSRLSDHGVTILSELEQTTKRVNQLLSPENQAQLMTTITGIGLTAESVRQLSASAQQLSGSMDSVVRSQLAPERVSIPQFVADATTTLKSLQKSADGVEQTAAEFRKTAAELTRVAERLNAGGGVVEQLAEGVAALTAAGQSFNFTTVPRINRTSDETLRAARQVSRAAGAVGDNPQALIFGHGPVAPGPGEPGFSVPKGAP